MSLSSQLMLIEQSLRSGQTNLLPALQDLYVQSHEDAALAWSDLAWLYLHVPSADSAQALQMARDHLERAIELRASCWQALDGLAELHHKLGEAEQARKHGLAALHAKHALAVQDQPLAEPSAYARRYWNMASELKVLAFSLFGQEAFYAEAAVRNASDAARWYPGWICRFYVGAEVSSAVKQRLRQAGAEVVMPPQAQAHLPGTIWRFMALDDLRVKTVLFRDADSLITEREVLAVQQWLASGMTAHVMRDHPMHTELILAGLWGAHSQSLRGVGDALLSFFKKPFHPTHADQHFLRDWVWPRIYRDVMQHDSVLLWHAEQMHATQDFPRPLASQEEHVGHAPTQWTQLQLPSHLAGTPAALNVQLQTAQEQLLGEYVVARGDGRYALRLPPQAMAAIESGQWRLNAVLPMEAAAKA
jgi:hypothetical protein